jgi:acyl-CoA synthetase (AMP-forming)/AMP-acid ligase II
MGPGYFVIAILGCADGGSVCTQVATLQTRYENQAQCSAATAAALEANSNFDFPTLLARCRAGAAGDRADAAQVRALPASARRG